MAKNHRGRIQAQGGNPKIEKSESWSEDEALTKEKGLKLLDKLWNKLTKKEKKERTKPYKDARRYIENVEGGIDATVKKTFRNRKTKDVRIDIEVLAGTAFMIILLLLLCNVI